MIEQALLAHLLADSGVEALVAERIHPLILPQGTAYPALTYQTVAGESHYAHGGPSGLASPRVQVDCYAGTHEAVCGLRDAVMAALSGFRGVAGSPPVQIQGVFKIVERDFHENTLERAGPRVWRKTLDFNVWFKES